MANGGLVYYGGGRRRVSASSPLEGVSASPACSLGWPDTVSSVSLLSEASVLLASGGESSELSFVVFFGDDPVDSWVLLDGVVCWINHDDFEELVGGVLSYPVGVEDSQVGASPC